jgi:nucleotide sugar dehydrogenase
MALNGKSKIEMKRLSVIGVGKLGLCFSLNLERCGYDIIGVDMHQDYVNLLNSKTLKSDEPYVEELLLKSSNFRATTDIGASLQNDLIFILVATPSLLDGKYDHVQIDRVADELISLGKQDRVKHLVICCTTMPGYCDHLAERMAPYNYTVSYNPEFIAQGTIVQDQLKPDVVLIGEHDTKAGDLIQAVYKDMCQVDPRYSRMTRTEAEITKIALNCFLTTKIAYANMVGDVAYNAGCSPDVILNTIGADSRIGSKYLKWGFGFGGPCFPRDNRAFGIFAEMMGVYPHISYATDQSNTDHVLHYSKTLSTEEKGTIIFESVAYKPGTTIIEESQQLKTALYLANQGYRVVIRETSRVIEQVKNLHGYKFVYEERN